MCTIISGIVALSGRRDSEAGRTVCKHYGRNSQTRNRICGSGSTRYEILGFSYHSAVSGGKAFHTGSYEQMHLLFRCHCGNHLVQ